MAGSRTGSDREPLNRDAIVAAAIALVEEDGVDALTMRSLAGRLGYKVMALYNHVANKDELLAAMLDAVATEIGPPPDGVEPLAAVRQLAVSAQQVLTRHPWAPALWLRYPPGPGRSRNGEDLLAAIDRSGLPPEMAHLAFHAVNNHVLGYTMQQQTMIGGSVDSAEMESRAAAYLASLPAGEYPLTAAHVRQHLDGDTSSSFEVVLDLILDGLVRLAAAR